MPRRIPMLMVAAMAIATSAPAQDISVPLPFDAADGINRSYVASGDFNGDGIGDVALGSGIVGDGIVVVYHGPIDATSTPDWTLTGDDPSFMGSGIANAGDVNGDGFDDLLVANPHTSADRGRLDLWFGSAAGFLEGATPNDADWTMITIATWPTFASWIAVASAGDVNSDGYADFMFGAPSLEIGDETGAAFVWYGREDFGGRVDESSADWVAWMPGAVYFAEDLAGGGDTNGDGYDDIVVADAYSNLNGTESGAIFAWYGGPGGLAHPASPSWFAVGDEHDNLGFYPCIAGDANGDGYAEVVSMGEPISGLDGFYHLGGPAVGSDATTPRPRHFIPTNGAKHLASAGDVTGDGLVDVITQDTQDTGASFLWFSGSTPFSRVQLVVQNHSETRYAAAGDVTGDGAPDLIGIEDGKTLIIYAGVKVWHSRYQRTTHAVSTPLVDLWGLRAIGDIDGDGIPEVAVGEPSFGEGLPRSGRLNVFSGQDLMVSGAEPVWFVNGDEAESWLGTRAAGGDLNGDGYSDLVVGGLQRHANRGSILIWFGSVDGIDALPVVAGADIEIVGGENDSLLGAWTSVVGDVNGDGFADLAAVVRGSAASHVIVWYGKPSGVSDDPEGDWKLAFPTSGRFGSGDVNGDGATDLITADDQGGVGIWYGRANGLTPDPIFDAADWHTDAYPTDNQVRDLFAADYDGNGYDDIVMTLDLYGADGGVFIIPGSELGPLLGSETVVELDSDWADNAGDVNGDGADDILLLKIGFRAYLLYGHTTSPRGVALRPIAVAPIGDVNRDGLADYVASDNDLEFQVVFGGGAAPTTSTFHASQRRVSDGIPVPPGGLAAEDDVIVSLDLTPAAGRSNVALEFEIKPSGVAFDGTGTTFTDWVDSGDPAAVGDAYRTPFELAPTGLEPDATYRWRARLHSDSVHYPHGAWRTWETDPSTNLCFRIGDISTPIQGPTGEAAPVVARDVRLAHPRPNPFSSLTSVSFTVPEASPVRLEVYGVGGRRVATLVDSHLESGRYQVVWDGRDEGGRVSAPGVYFAQLTSPGKSLVRKMTKLP